MQTETKRRWFKSGIALGLVSFILLTPTISLGWGAGGHMIVAQIAYTRLNRRAKAQANALLARPIEPVAVTAKSKDFVNAAHWPDDLRPFSEFDKFKPLHFIDMPFTTDGTPLPALPTPDIVQALQDNVNILKTSTDKDAQAEALRFIIHFVGDIHQPMHCTARVTSAHPTGDQGGNLVALKVPGKNGTIKSTNLHSYWDGGLGSFPPTGPNFAPPPLSSIPAAAKRARTGNPASAAAVKLKDPFNFQSWADESFALAKDVAYDGITNGGSPTAAYTRKGIKVARRRVAWGGYRLAALLNTIWP